MDLSQKKESQFMKTLVLIDGNSLLNRAYYATRPLSTRDGTPTNAVFGFTKLLLKILQDIDPDNLVVTFDLKEPTFRHKMYTEYKATRKPMPDDLAVQVGMVKELLRSMGIAMCEKGGYEADDLIGTLSHKFHDMKSIVITGDKDSYQLVDEYTDVYLTKTGVSDLLKLNAENFEQIIGYPPARVVDMKALMGDASDNIPGVAGVGEKTARALVEKYGDLDNIYSHIGDITGSLQTKLINGKESAYFSRTLATIDRDVPLDMKADDCAVHLPFSAEVRTQFEQLEFTSLLKPDLFGNKSDTVQAVREVCKAVAVESDYKEILECLCSAKRFSAVKYNGVFYFYDGLKEHIVKPRLTLLDEGLQPSDIACLLQKVFCGKDCTVILYNSKDFRHALRSEEAELSCKYEDVSIIKYLVDYTGKEDDLKAALQSHGYDDAAPAFGIWKLFEELEEKLRAEKLEPLYRDVELPLSDVLFHMEISGVKMDMAASAQFEKRYREEIAAATSDIYAEAGETFNVNSPAQLGTVLFDKLRLPAPKKSKRGTYSTGADVLEKLADDYKIVRDVLRCRHYQKLLSTYIDGFKPLVDPVTGLVHTTFNQVLTSTGRLSSANPNLQNIPVRDDDGRELRKLFVARDQDHILIDADYSQIELRLLAHFSGCKELIQAYREGRDIHALTASQVFGVPIGEVSPAQRRAAKAVNFGIIYGISDFGLASNLSISTKQAGEYIRKYFETYSDVKKYMDSNVAFAREHGYVTTLLGRKRVIPEIRSSNYNIRSFGERAAMNMPLQGSSADIIKIAMVRIYERMEAEKLRSKLILQVHDELVIDALIEEKERVSDILKTEMENAAHLNVPLVADVHCGKNWYEAK